MSQKQTLVCVFLPAERTERINRKKKGPAKRMHQEVQVYRYGALDQPSKMKKERNKSENVDETRRDYELAAIST